MLSRKFAIVGLIGFGIAYVGFKLKNDQLSLLGWLIFMVTAMPYAYSVRRRQRRMLGLE